MQTYSATYSVLIADDHQLIIDGISKILQDEKSISAIYTASNGKEAVEMVTKHDIDCVLMDLNMPVLSGYDATKLIKEQRPQVKIIVVSMISDALIIAKLLKAGADAFIIKKHRQGRIVKGSSQSNARRKIYKPGA